MFSLVSLCQHQLISQNMYKDAALLLFLKQYKRIKGFSKIHLEKVNNNIDGGVGDYEEVADVHHQVVHEHQIRVLRRLFPSSVKNVLSGRHSNPNPNVFFMYQVPHTLHKG